MSPVSASVQNASEPQFQAGGQEPFLNPDANKGNAHVAEITAPKIANNTVSYVSAGSAAENDSSAHSAAKKLASADKPVVNLNVAVNSLDALMSAVSNLNSIMDPRAKVVKKAQEHERKNSIAARMVVSAEQSTSPQTLLPDSKLPLARRVFDYIDALREHEAEFDEEQLKEDKDSVNSQLIEARTKARTVVSQAVSMGVAELDYIPTDVEVQSDAADEFDPFAGGSADALHVAAGNVPDPLHPQGIENSAFSPADSSLSKNEVLSIVSAVHDDIKTHAEDESAGEREKSVDNIRLQSDAAMGSEPQSNGENATASAVIKDHGGAVISSDSVEAVSEIKRDDTLYADGVALSADLVEGQREGESVEEMLRRVQQTALEQLRQDDALNGPQAYVQNKADDSIADSNAAAAVNLNTAHEDRQSNTVSADAESNASENTSAPMEHAKTQAPLQNYALEKDTAIDDVAESNASETGKEPESVKSAEHNSSANHVQVLLLDDPYEDEKASHAETLIEGTSLGDAVATAKRNEICTEHETSDSVTDVVGELLRSQLQALDTKDSGRIFPDPKASARAENTAGSGTASDGEISLNTSDKKNISSAVPVSSDNEISVPAVSDDEPPADAEFDDEEDDNFDSQAGYSSSFTDFDEKDALLDAGTTQGIQVLPDGRTDDVPIAERMERERIENADKIAQGRALEPDDFIAEVIGSDPWGCDFVAAGYSEGAVFSALCASVRCIDPSDPDHWIVVMSDSFKIFAIDPNFVNGLMERFSSLKKHHIEISIQLSQGFPQGSPRDLCVRAFGAASEKARHDLASDPAVQQIAQLAGADLRYCAVKLFALS